ncbi:hypothetical protein OBB00_02415 [Gammaproteobacteria bacterium]|nr:hypothetical protein [Gammaproteobacteria bacterium]
MPWFLQDRVGPVFLLLSLPLVYVLADHLNADLSDLHGFRQAQTAITAFYINFPFDFLVFETPLFGAPWSVPMEYPIYQIATAGVSQGLGIDLEVCGKLLSFLAYVSAFFVLKQLLTTPFQRRLFACCYFTSPILLAYSGKFLIEAFAFLFGTMVLVSFFSLARRWKVSVAAVFVISTTLCGLQKITNLMSIALSCGVYLLILMRGGEISAKKLLVLFVLGGLSGILPVGWFIYTELVKGESYILSFLQSAALQYWNFGTFAQRIEPANLANVFGFRAILLGGMLPLVLLAILGRKTATKSGGKLCGHETGITVSLLIAGISAPLLFFNLFLIHDYYFFASTGFLLAGVVRCFKSDVSFGLSASGVQRAVALFCVASLNLAIYAVWYSPKIGEVPESHALMTEVGDYLGNNLAQDQIFVTAGVDWDATIPYLAERRAIMIPSWERAETSPQIDGRYFDPLVFLGELEQLRGGYEIGALVACDVRSAGYYLKVVEALKEIPNFTWRSIDGCDVGLRIPVNG